LPEDGPSLLGAEAKLNSPHHEIKTILERVLSIGLVVLLTCSALLKPNVILAEPVVVRHIEGLTRGFLVLQTLDGNSLADGDLTQIASGGRVTDHLIFHFKDGSLYEETFVFTQHGTFRLLSDHLIQKGPAFKRQMETSLDASTGKVTANYTDSDGKMKIVDERLKLPTDLANGMIPILLNNLQPNAPQIIVSMIVATPKPRLVKLEITRAGEEPFTVGGSTRKATRYVVKVELGGAAGLLAPLVGDQPLDTNVWILGGPAPTFLKSEGPLYDGGPIWRIETVSPVWPQSHPQQ
jgi:hypothetical protein